MRPCWLQGEWRVRSKFPVPHSFDLTIHSVAEIEQEDPHTRIWRFDGGAHGLYRLVDASAILDTRVNHLNLKYSEEWAPGLDFGKKLRQLSSELTQMSHEVWPKTHL